MSQQTKTAWGAIAAALIAILAAKPEFFLGIITDHAGILAPMAAASILALAIPHRFKHCLPSSRYVPALSAGVCIFTYMTFRASWLMKFGGAYTIHDGVIDFLIAAVLAALIPILYDQLPASVRARWSYTALKRVRTATGEIVERPANQPSGDGEKTVRLDP